MPELFIRMSSRAVCTFQTFVHIKMYKIIASTMQFLKSCFLDVCFICSCISSSSVGDIVKTDRIMNAGKHSQIFMHHAMPFGNHVMAWQ